MPHKLNMLCFTLIILSRIGFSQNTFVPDDNFEQALINLGYDTGPLDNIVPTANINTVTSLNVSLLNIADLTGIEDFIALEVLECSENNLTKLDISKNTNLKQLFCGYNAIESLDVSLHPELAIIWCNFNKISNLNVSKNPKLISLICSNNLLTSLNVSNNPSIKTLLCIGNQLSNLDVSFNKELSIFHCGNNNLTALDVSQNLLLSDFNFEYNTIQTIDLSNNRDLRLLYCLSNNLEVLNLSNNNELSVLSCGENQLVELNLNANTKLEELYCQSNALKELNLSTNTLLNNLDCSNNRLCQLNIQNANNTNIQLFNTTLNNQLICVFVDDPAYSSTNWTVIDAQSRFVSNRDECTEILNDLLGIDVLDDVYATSYTLPEIFLGNYYTKPFGNGLQLNAGTTINTSQTIYIYSGNACYENQSSFRVFITLDGIFIPKYFTPNNDGINDIWKVVDVNNTINNISIYNRFGKLIKHLPFNSNGWDGRFNGQFLPNNTYWYEIILNNTEILRGYFALKR